MIIAGVTLNQTPMDWTGNVQNILTGIEKAKASNASLICFPELSICGYGCEDNFLSDWLWRNAFQKVVEHILPASKDISLVVGCPIFFEGLLYNTALYIKNGAIQYIIPKQNLANDGVHYEPRWFTAWKNGRQEKILIAGKEYPIGDYVIEDHGFKIGFEICEDAWRIDRPAKQLCERGVNLILNPSASHFALKKTKSRHQLVSNSSKQFNCLYLYVNLLGNEAGRMIYDGEILAAYEGEIIAQNELLSFEPNQMVLVDSQELTQAIKVEEPNSQQEFLDAGSLALYDYLRKSRSRGFVLSLSGGADSSSCAILVSNMVRKGIKTFGLERFLKNIHRTDLIDKVSASENAAKDVCKHIFTTAYQGTQNSGEATLRSARELAEEVGATFHHWLIDEEVASYTSKIETALGRKLGWETDDIALQNIQARSRSPIIWMLANIENALLLTTSNRSEGSVGYTTMDGDTSGSIAPIAAIDKAFIREWLKWAENTLGYQSLNYVNNLDPSAELRPSDQTQTDEKDLMPYPLLQAIEQEAIKLHRSPSEVYLTLKDSFKDHASLKKHIQKFFQLWSRNQWKRERLAPSFHLDDYNVDPKTWCRFPILSSGFQEELKALENLD